VELADEARASAAQAHARAASGGTGLTTAPIPHTAVDARAMS
jgi:hypothetical protein